jgi:hypothetical protein
MVVQHVQCAGDLSCVEAGCVLRKFLVPRKVEEELASGAII